MDLRKKRRWLNIGVVGVIALVAIGCLAQLMWLVGLSILLLIVWLVLACRYWRCPFCGGYLGRIDQHFTYCPHCGKELGCDERSDGRS